MFDSDCFDYSYNLRTCDLKGTKCRFAFEEQNSFQVFDLSIIALFRGNAVYMVCL